MLPVRSAVEVPASDSAWVGGVTSEFTAIDALAVLGAVQLLKAAVTTYVYVPFGTPVSVQPVAPAAR